MRPFRARLLLLLIFVFLPSFDTHLSALGDDAEVRGEGIDFERDIRPLLIGHCAECHGATSQRGGLRLDARHAALKGGDSGPAFVPFQVDESELLRRITSSDMDERMPPEDKAPLTPTQVKLLSAWIAAGADWPESEYDRQSKRDPRLEHWSFQPPTVRVPESVVAPSDRPYSTPLDRFIDAKHAELNLKRAPSADRRTLIRRLSFDLLGLPPTYERIEAFVNDRSLEAWSNLVDEMLASPRYGERWAQHWLDVIRYADTHGFEVNTPRDNAWRYRDYVIRAFNEDKPYDQFIVEQLAGDLCGADEATGFLVAAAVLLPGQIGADDVSKRLARQDALDEIISGTSATFLGLTISCARCHDHKFDPITQRDYYALQDFFAGVDYGDREIHDPDYQDRLAQAHVIDARIEQIQAELDALELLASIPPISDQHDTESPIIRRRPPVNARRNVERFLAVDARFVRFTSLETINNNQHEPCIDELEVYGVNNTDTNLALSKSSAVATSSGNYADEGQHQLAHINDGQYGNSRSWISDQLGQGWVQIELPVATRIERVIWGRDRHGEFEDRLAIRYRIDVSIDGIHWQAVASDADRLLGGDGKSTTVPDGTEAADRAGQQVAMLVAERDQLRNARELLARPAMVYGGVFREPDKTFVLRRGDPEQKLEPISATFPQLFSATQPPLSTTESDRRLALARWIASSTHPLTARVMANRVWQYHFGRGLVDTPSDFGINGSRPTHPELLDWLATELVRSGWSLKHLHRIIVMSETYQQSDVGDPTSRDIDRDNRYLWRFPARRLESEAIRDSLLAVTGELNLAMGGPGFNFFQSRGGLDGFAPVENFGPDQMRRMVYAHKVRMERVPVFGAFDCPDSGQAMPARSRSTTAIQALNLFNSPFVIERGNVLANQVESEDVSDDVEACFRRVLGRNASSTEVLAATDVVRQHGLSTLCRVLFNCNEFLFLP